MADALARSLRRLATASEKKAPERAAAVVDDLRNLIERELGAVRSELARIDERITTCESRLAALAADAASICDEQASIRDEQARIAEDVSVSQVAADDLAVRTHHIEAEVGLMRDAMSSAAALARDSRRRVVRLEPRAAPSRSRTEAPSDSAGTPLV
jgi:chromosome segregation ATPase